MELKPEADKPTSFERLVCELLKKDEDLSVMNQGTEVQIWLQDWSLVISSNGKWRLE